MSAATRTPEERAHEFVAAVRDRLSDLSTDEADELTDGLTADLLDRLSDGGELGNPAQYADELRQAAGLPERVEPEPERSQSLRERGQRIAAGWRGWWDATASQRGVRDFALALRPVWWLLRGLLVAQVVSWVLVVPLFSLPWLLMATVAVLLSVQWGRGTWLWGGWGVWLRRIGSVLAIIALLPAASSLSERVRYADAVQDSGSLVDPGLTLNGQDISNVFAYDCHGEPIDAVQLYTQDGQRLHTVGVDPTSAPGDMVVSGENGQGSWVEFRKNAAATTPEEWNVFPLWEVEDLDDYVADPFSEGSVNQGTAPRPPYERVSALGGCETGVAGEPGEAEKSGAAEKSGEQAKPERDADPESADPADPVDPADPEPEKTADPADAKDAP